MSVARRNQDFCELMDDVFCFTKYISNANDPGMNDLLKEWPNLLTKLCHEREKVANKIVPILVLGMCFIPILIVCR